MATFAVEPGTLKTSVIPQKGERKTLISEWVDAVTGIVARGEVQLEGRAGPTASARFYSMAGTAMYEAWQGFRRGSRSSLGDAKASLRHDSGAEDVDRKVVENTISHTVLKVLRHRSSGLTDAGQSEIKQFLKALKHDLASQQNEVVRSISAEVARKVIKAYRDDGHDQLISYKPANKRPDRVVDLEQWTPEYQVNGDKTSGLQTFLTPQWGNVDPFGLSRKQLRTITGKAKRPQPFLIDPDDTYDLKDGVIFDDGKGPGIAINKDAVGSLINPEFIRQTQKVLDYSRRLTADEKGARRKGIAEYWEDGAGTPFPPGTWMTFGQYAALANGNTLGQDAKLFLGLGATVFNASISAWDLKLNDNYARPVRAVRELSRLGLLADLDGDPSNGSQFKAYNRKNAQIDIITGQDWETYQGSEGGYSPPFPEYVSGHSAFSASAAEYLRRFTGSRRFGGSVDFNLVFDYENGGPAKLQWKTWEEAAKQAGLSRLWGGIHFPDGNRQGLKLGQVIGATVHDNLSQLWI